jgi:hypothetical protein
MQYFENQLRSMNAFVELQLVTTVWDPPRLATTTGSSAMCRVSGINGSVWCCNLCTATVLRTTANLID